MERWSSEYWIISETEFSYKVLEPRVGAQGIKAGGDREPKGSASTLAYAWIKPGESLVLIVRTQSESRGTD